MNDQLDASDWIERPRPTRRWIGTASVCLLAPVALTCLALVLFGALAPEIAVGAAAAVTLALVAMLRRQSVEMYRVLDILDRLGRDDVPNPGDRFRARTWLALAEAEGIEEKLVVLNRRWRDLELSADSHSRNLGALLDSLPDPQLLLDGGGKVVRGNRAAEAMFALDLTGRDIATLLRAPELLEAVDQALQGDDDRTVTFSLPGAISHTYTAGVRRLGLAPMTPWVALVSLRDVTEERRSEETRADFVANVSHELRTPLSSLSGFIETLRGPAREDPEAMERFLEIMEHQASRMTRIVADLLSLSRIELREHSAPRDALDLVGLMEKVVDPLRVVGRKKNVAIELNADHGLPSVVGDEEQLAQVFQNLIDNAIKYCRPGSRVRVTANAERLTLVDATEPTPMVRGSVSDEGEGIPREHIPRLTERFYRVDTARSRDLGGTGLGLAIVKHIVNRHRGALDIKSVVGEGSTFSVLLPVALHGTSAGVDDREGRLLAVHQS